MLYDTFLDYTGDGAAFAGTPYSANATFKSRYLVNDRYARKGGPILLYTGNEANVELFYNTSGFQV